MARILVVDDEQYMRDMLADLLADAGHVVDVAIDGEEGESMFQLYAPDLVVTDILMPNKGGLNLIRDVRQQSPDTRIVAISGGGKDGKLNYLRTAGTFPGVVTLNKPFGHQELLQAVQEALG